MVYFGTCTAKKPILTTTNGNQGMFHYPEMGRTFFIICEMKHIYSLMSDKNMKIISLQKTQISASLKTKQLDVVYEKPTVQ